MVVVYVSALMRVVRPVEDIISAKVLVSGSPFFLLAWAMALRFIMLRNSWIAKKEFSATAAVIMFRFSKLEIFNDWSSCCDKKYSPK